MKRVMRALRGSGSRSRNVDPSEEHEAVEQNVSSEGTEDRESPSVIRRRVARRTDVLESHRDPNLRPDKQLADFRKLADREEHVSTLVDISARSERTRGSWAGVVRLYSQIREYDTDATIHTFLSSIGLGDFLSIERLLNNDVQLCGALAACWWKTTHTFHFGFGEMGITPLDFSMITGLAIGQGAPLPYDEVYQNYVTLRTLFPHLNPNDSITSNFQIKCSGIKLAIQKLLTKQPKVHHLEIARLFVLYMMGNLFFTNSSSSLSCGYVAVVEPFSFDGSPTVYDWGTPILAYLYRSLDLQCVVRTRVGSITGFWEILQYWYFEYFHNLSFPTVDPSLSTFYPRVRAWSVGNRRLVPGGQARHVFAIARNQIELRRTRDAVIWHPFDESRGLADPPSVHALYLSSRRFPLVSCPPSLGCFWYLGERCWRQIYDGDAVPDDPHPHTAIPRVYSTSALQEHADVWWPASDFILTGRDYISFWRQYYSPPQTGSFVHAASVDLVGPSALRTGVEPPFVLDVSQSTQVYHAPQDPPPPRSSEVPDYGWTVAVPTTYGSDRYIDIPRPEVTEYPDPAVFSYQDLYQMTLGLRQAMYREHQRSIEELTARMNELRSADEERYGYRPTFVPGNDDIEDVEMVPADLDDD